MKATYIIFLILSSFVTSTPEDWINLELTTHQMYPSFWIKKDFEIGNSAIIAGTYMTPLTDNQTVACQLADLAFGYWKNVSNENEHVNFNGVNKSRKYVMYDFGISKINSVYLVKDNARFDVFISDGKNIDFITTCEMSPILEWAFEEAASELMDAQFIIDEEYKPYHYKLTLMIDSVPIIVESSSMRVKEIEGTAKKIDELKKFIISLWVNSLNLENKSPVPSPSLLPSFR